MPNTNTGITWKLSQGDIIELTNTSNENFLLELDSGITRLDAGHTLRVTDCALEIHQVNQLINAGKITVGKFQKRKGHYMKPPLRDRI